MRTRKPKSVTFIPAKVTDNIDLMDSNPDYLDNLDAMFDYEKKRLKEGNWFARPSAGELFKTTYWRYTNELPARWQFVKIARYWDKASTLPSDKNPDPDYTVGALVGITDKGKTFVLDVVRDRLEPADVVALIGRTMQNDKALYGNVETWIEQDPGSSGKMESDYYMRKFIGNDISINPKRTNKLAYWRPLASQLKEGTVYIYTGEVEGSMPEWVNPFVRELEGVTDGTQAGHDDQADAASGAFMVIYDSVGDGDARGSALGGIA